ncbi:hypothetical protein HDV05_006389 [Chytridiales sp. JEL 0842]|nr:hypothetical protein HDV05_006389 [Chytridiales sp. JEL 0842]
MRQPTVTTDQAGPAIVTVTTRAETAKTPVPTECINKPTILNTVTVGPYRAYIQEDPTGPTTIEGLAGKTWPAAILMADYFQWRYGGGMDSCNKGVETKTSLTCLELGAGTGITSILLNQILCAASSSKNTPSREHTIEGSLVVVTDLNVAMPLIQLNIDTNPSHLPERHRVIARPLEWSNETEWTRIRDQDFTQFQKEEEIRPIPDLVFAADVVYYPHLFDLLIQTLIHLTPPNTPHPEIILACRLRELSKETPFYGKLGKYFHLHPVLEWDMFWRKYKSEGFVMLRLERREVELEGEVGEEFECMMMGWMMMGDGSDDEDEEV